MSQPFSTEDLYLHQRVKTVHGVPGFDRVVCEVRRVGRDADQYETTIWEFPLNGGEGRQLTFGTDDSTPRLSPDGQRLAFLAKRDGESVQLHCIERTVGEARRVSQLDRSVEDFRWLPDGSGWVLTSAVTASEDRSGPWARLPDKVPGKLQVEVGWRLPYKEDGIGNVLSRHIHLFKLDAQSGEVTQLTEGPFDVMGFDVSADGRSVAYTRTREGRYAHDYDLWTLPLGGGEPRRLTSNHAMVMQPKWSPDGRRIAFTGAVDEGDAESRLWLVDVASGRIDEVCPGELDVADPLTVFWSQDGKRLHLGRGWRGRHHIVTVDPASGEITTLVGGDRQMTDLVRAGDGFAYCVEHPSLPSDVWTCALDGSGERRVSDLNAWWNDRVCIVAESREFEVPDGKGSTERIQGWLLRGKDTTGPAPLLNDVHGGPASYALLDFDTNVFWQVLCSRGWAVLALNAVGSATFGREFCQRLAGHWGELDLPQHLAAIEQLQAEGVCDDRLAISGKSYGGYLSGYTIGHTEKFKAAVVMAPVGNIETHYGTSDGGYYADPYYMGTQPRFDRELAAKLSPMQAVEKARTPTLFMQGKEDERCPKCQSEELFVSLYNAGNETPTQLVLYPGETHSFLGEGTPSCRFDAANRIVAWIEHYCR